MRSFMIILYPLILLLSTSFAREVTIDLKAPWNQRSIDSILEIGEFISTHSHENFWKYLSSLCDSHVIIDQALHNQTVEMRSQINAVATQLGSQILPRNIHNLMKAAQKLEMYAPTTVFYESITSQYGTPCGDGISYVLIYPTEEIFCQIDGESLKKSYGYIDEDKYVTKWDYRYPTTSVDVTAVPVAILHGIPGTSSFCSLHQSLTALSHTNSVNYVFRPAFPGVSPMTTSRPLQGYGVYLDIKNMEYKNVDDKDEGKEGNNSPAQNIQFEKGEEIQGVIFSTLQERKPELTKELSILREEILADESLNADGVTEMKVSVR